MQEVHELLEKFSHVRLARPEDNQDILSFLEKQSMKAGNLALDFRRDPDFFLFSKRHSDSYLIFLILNDDSSIGGTGSLLIKQRWLNGHPARVGYFGDLRVDPKASRKSHVQWRKAYLEVNAQLKTPGSSCYCENVFTAVLAENKVALNSLTNKLKGLRYSSVADYEVSSLISRIPLRKMPAPRCTIDDTEDRDFFEFLEQEAKHHHWSPLGPDQTAESEWRLRKDSWPEWNAGPTFVARDHNRQVVGCVKAWQDQSRRLIAKKIPSHLKWLGRILPHLGRPILREGSPVEVLQLSNFFISSDLPGSQRKGVALTLLEKIHSHPLSSRYHLINWVPNPGDPDLEDLASGRYLQVKTSGRLFEVHLESEPASLGSTSSAPIQRYYFDGTL